MDYLFLPVGRLLSGPLLKTPQGWSVLLIAALCWSFALWVGYFQQAVPWWSSKSHAVELATVWPFAAFMFFLRDSLPACEPSWVQAGLRWVYTGFAFGVLHLWMTRGTGARGGPCSAQGSLSL